MPVYSYKGVGANGKKTSGVIDADSIKTARLKLRKLQVFPTHLQEGRSAPQSRRRLGRRRGLKVDKLALLTRQLATLIGASVPLVDALSALVDQTEDESLKNVLSEVRERVREGARLADSLKAYPHIFGELYCSMVQSGEISGELNLVLSRLADFTERQAQIQRKVRSAMIYPIIMGIVGLLVVVLLMIFMVPKLTEMFKTQKMALPIPTQILIGSSNFFLGFWWLLLLLIILGVWLARRYVAKPEGRLKVDGIKLRLPIFGELFRFLAISRMSRTLATLMRSGVQLMFALETVKGVVENKVISGVIEQTRGDVKEGESIAQSLKKSGQFPPLMTHMVAIGEKTGELETMLEHVANTYDERIDNKASNLMTALQPIIIVAMGLFVAFIVAAVMLPMLQLNQSIQG